MAESDLTKSDRRKDALVYAGYRYSEQQLSRICADKNTCDNLKAVFYLCLTHIPVGMQRLRYEMP